MSLITWKINILYICNSYMLFYMIMWSISCREGFWKPGSRRQMCVPTPMLLQSILSQRFLCQVSVGLYGEGLWQEVAPLHDVRKVSYWNIHAIFIKVENTEEICQIAATLKALIHLLIVNVRFNLLTPKTKPHHYSLSCNTSMSLTKRSVTIAYWQLK